MPLTEIEEKVFRLLRANRNPESHVAGASVLHRGPASPRYSGDIDLFHDEVRLVAENAERDVATLRAAGLVIEWAARPESFHRAWVVDGAQRLKIEWVFDSAFRFFPVEPTPSWGIGFIRRTWRQTNCWPHRHPRFPRCASFARNLSLARSTGVGRHREGSRLESALYLERARAHQPLSPGRFGRRGARTARLRGGAETKASRRRARGGRFARSLARSRSRLPRPRRRRPARDARSASAGLRRTPAAFWEFARELAARGSGIAANAAPILASLGRESAPFVAVPGCTPRFSLRLLRLFAAISTRPPWIPNSIRPPRRSAFPPSTSARRLPPVGGCEALGNPPPCLHQQARR